MLISWDDALTHGAKQMLPTYTSPCPKHLSVSHNSGGSCHLALSDPSHKDVLLYMTLESSGETEELEELPGFQASDFSVKVQSLMKYRLFS